MKTTYEIMQANVDETDRRRAEQREADRAATPTVGEERDQNLIWILEKGTDYQLVNARAALLTALAPPASPLRGMEISFGYTNWRGETSHRHAQPISLRYGSSEYHKRPGWLMLALDLDKNEQREFSMCDMILVEPANEIVVSCAPPEQPALRGTSMTAQRALEISANIAEDWPGNTGAEIAKAIRDVAERRYWTRDRPASKNLSGCQLRSGECEKESKCLAHACDHYGKTTFRPRMTLEPQVDGILYPKVET